MSRIVVRVMDTYRLLAIDLDGTLLCPKGTVTARVKSAIHGALDKGYIICFATGRNATESRQILKDVDHHPCCVFVGGAVVTDTSGNNCLHRSLMHPELARELCQAFESNGHAALALQDSGDSVDYLISGRHDLNEATLQWQVLTQAVYHPTPNLAEHHHQHTLRVGIVAGVDEIERLKGVLTSQFGNRIVSHRLNIPSFQVEVLEAFDPAVNKWAGVQFVARRHGILPEQIIAIGDDVNDIPMIRNAGLGVAMGNAHPEVRAIAKRLIRSNREEGLAEFLEELSAGKNAGAAA